MSLPVIAMVGVGNVGGALVPRFLDAGFQVVVGLSPKGSAADLPDAWRDRVTAKPAAQAAAEADVIVLAVPGGVAVEAVKALGELKGKVILDTTNPIRWDAGPVWTPPAEGSNAAAIAAASPGARVLKALNTFGAEFHARPSAGGRPVDTFIAGDTAETRAQAADWLARIGFAPIDFGPLRNAAVLENTAILWIHLALAAGHGRDFVIGKIAR
jgi:8-hydroxy-5-deazaflavin:NADPH oxidoreductase